MKCGNPPNQAFRNLRRRPGRRFPNFRPGGLRTKTEFIGFAGRRTQTAPATGPPSSKFQARRLRTETDFIGFPGSRTQTAPASGPPFSKFQARWFAYGNRIHWFCRPAYANRAGAFEHHFSLISYPILPIALPPPQHREVHLKKTTYFFNTVPFSEPLFKKSVIFLNSMAYYR